MQSDNLQLHHINDLPFSILLFFRPRRRSGSSIVVLGGDDTLKPRLPPDDYQETLDMYTMISLNQDNGESKPSFFLFSTSVD
jgi:hypothetical protein